jgi:cellulose synthase/poly-beta-1,6-N-acetylglucosamine synthase-like glycosyltransferase
MSATQPLRLVLITPARNEEAFIGGTIESVVAQTVRPIRWVIVSDGSTDRTDEIVKSFAATHPWIELLRMPDRRDRQFAAKASAFNAGFQRLKDLDFDVVGNLDADITLGPDYLEFLLGRSRSSAWRVRRSSKTPVVRERTRTRTTRRISITSRARASFSGARASKPSGATSRSRAAPSTGSPSRRLA